jgi:hypothetical protein
VLSGPIAWKHIGLCSVNGTQEQRGEISARISGWGQLAKIDATISFNGARCAYSGRCPAVRAVSWTVQTLARSTLDNDEMTRSLAAPQLSGFEIRCRLPGATDGVGGAGEIQIGAAPAFRSGPMSRCASVGGRKPRPQGVGAGLKFDYNAHKRRMQEPMALRCDGRHNSTG